MQDIIKHTREYALSELKNYGTPKEECRKLSYEKWQELAEKLWANKDIVALGTLLMDIKLGECTYQNKAHEHTQKSIEATQIFLQQYKVDQETIDEVTACVGAHHGMQRYPSLEAEICANADCYRILHPRWFTSIIILFGRRNESTNWMLEQLEGKVEEKHKILSIDICKQELEPYYHQFKKLILEAKEG